VKPALLLAGHGTRDPEGVAGFTALTRRLSAREHSAGGPAGAAADRMAVAGGFIELSAPPLRDAVSELAASGHRTLVAAPRPATPRAMCPPRWPARPRAIPGWP